MDIAVLIGSLGASWSIVVPYIVNIILALLLILVGLLIAKGLGYLTSLVARGIRVDQASKQIGFDDLLEKGNIKKSASDLLGDLVYWAILFIAVIGVLGFFGLPVVYAVVDILSYMSYVVLAALVLGIGMFLAGLISGIVRTVMGNFGLEGAKIVSRLIYYFVVIFAFLAALAQLGIGTDLFVPQIGVIIGGVALAAAIAFGLGCKDMAADFLHNLFKGK